MFRDNVTKRGICNMWVVVVVVAVTIIMSGFSFHSSVSAFPLKSVIHHNNKVFDNDKNQGSGSSRDSSSSNSLDTKSSDNSNEGNDNNNNENNNNHGTRDSSDTNADTNSQVLQSAKSPEKKQQHGSTENVAPIGTATPTPETTCEQGSNCTDQQGLTDQDRSTTSADTTKVDNTPFVLSLPFP
jgi:fructose-specific phosphotransferase system component IIB